MTPGIPPDIHTVSLAHVQQVPRHRLDCGEAFKTRRDMKSRIIDCAFGRKSHPATMVVPDAIIMLPSSLA